MQVKEAKGEDVVCLIKNSATLSGSLYTLHVSQIRIDLPTLTDKDKEVNCSHIIFFNESASMRSHDTFPICSGKG